MNFGEEHKPAVDRYLQSMTVRFARLHRASTGSGLTIDLDKPMLESSARVWLHENYPDWEIESLSRE